MTLMNRGRLEEVEHMTLVTLTCDACLKKMTIKMDGDDWIYCPKCGRR